ncbi:MAG: hypothetical protein NVV60_02575 [Luteimonas sp.]|nr:hypothetical protein [Luteimonas sp.]
MAASRKACGHQQQARRAEGFGQSRGQPWPEDRAQRASDRDQGEEALGLFAAETVCQQSPEHHGHEQVEDAEPDEEHLSAPRAHRSRREYQQPPEPGQAEREEQVGGRDEVQPAEAADQPAEHGVHQQRDHGGADEQPADAFDAALHAQRVARRAQQHQCGQDAEEEHRADQHRRDLVPTQVQCFLQETGGATRGWLAWHGGLLRIL